MYKRTHTHRRTHTHTHIYIYKYIYTGKTASKSDSNKRTESTKVAFKHSFFLFVPHLFIYYVITHSKGSQDWLLSDVLRLLASFGSFNNILALPSDTTKTLIPVVDPAIKMLTKYATPHSTQLKKSKYYYNWTLNSQWSIRNDILYFPSSYDQLRR